MPEQESEGSSQELPADNEAEEEYEKTVTMVGYDADFDFPSLKAWAEELTGAKCTDTKLVREEKRYLVYDLGKQEQRARVRDYQCDEEAISTLKSKLEAAGIEEVRIETETKSRTEPKVSLSQAGSQFLKTLFEECPDVLSGGLERHEHNWTRWVHPDHKWEVRLKSETFDEQRILAKESERQSDDRYESMSEVPAFNFVVKITAPNEELIDTWTEEVVTNLHKAMSERESIGKVRYMACTVTQERTGECYSI